MRPALLNRTWIETGLLVLLLPRNPKFMVEPGAIEESFKELQLGIN